MTDTSIDTAKSVDKYITQMHTEMAELGEGGTEAMDMGIQILFLDDSSLGDPEDRASSRLIGAK